MEAGKTTPAEVASAGGPEPLSPPLDGGPGSSPARQGGRRPSIADVASFAGVSHQTVSRVLNMHASVSKPTRARVLAAIEQLGYRPNTAARALASGRSKTLGVVALDTTLYGPVSTLSALQQAAQLHGYFVSVMAVRSIDRQSVREAVQRLTSQAVEGLAIIAPFTSAHDALAYLPTGTPVVAVEGDPEADVAVVTVDQVAGARWPPSTCLPRGTRPSSTWLGPPNGKRAEAGSTAGAPPLKRLERRLPHRSWATGALARVTKPARFSRRYPTPPRSSSPTTTWRWAPYGHCTSEDDACPKTLPWWASMTHPSPPTSSRRSPRCARISSGLAAPRCSCWWTSWQPAREGGTGLSSTQS